jgi:hypothetical protein
VVALAPSSSVMCLPVVRATSTLDPKFIFSSGGKAESVLLDLICSAAIRVNVAFDFCFDLMILLMPERCSTKCA